jgi:hypothetical protein
MRTRCLGLRGSLAVAAVMVVVSLLAGTVIAQTPAAKNPVKAYTPARMPWGDPDIAGVYTNNDESLIPFERPTQFEGRRLEDVTEAELDKLRDDRSDQRNEADRNRAEFRSPIHWFENHFPNNSRAWLVTDPPDGHVPPPTDEAQQGAAARAIAQRDRGPADSAEDRSLYDRCITRGIPGSMMPAVYGNAYEIVQGPGYVSILYEMVHEARVIPLDGRPHPGQNIRMYMGDARGHWDGNALVVETTNFTDKTAYRGSSAYLKMIERFKPIAKDTVEWSVTFDDPHTWERPWTFAINLAKKDDSQRPFEYACNEGNFGMVGILKAARAEEREGKDVVSPREAEGER